LLKQKLVEEAVDGVVEILELPDIALTDMG
jgi:hypothetical protein